MSLIKRCFMNSPMLLTIFLFCASYYVYITTNPISSTSKIIASSIFHIFLLLSISSLLCTFITSPGEVNQDYSPESISDNLRIHYTEEMSEIDYSIARISFCKKCDKYRPPRSHHCSVCDKCVLRYEHHCPFVGNCIGFRTIKPFILFLIYTSISLLVLTVIIFMHVLDSYSNTYLIFLICSLALFVFLTGFSFSQIAMAAENVVTLEVPWSHRIFDTGSYLANVEQVCGSSCLCWFFPCSIVEGGYQYPMKIRRKNMDFIQVENKYLV